MTMTKVLEHVRTRKACSVAQLRRYIKALKIEPLGARQVPQQWPADTGNRILVHLGLNGEEAHSPIVGLDKLKKVRSAAKSKAGK